MFGTGVSRTTIAAALAAALLLGGPASADSHGKESQNGEVHWGYEGAEGPEHWGELSPAFAACGQGRSQSPMDIANAEPADMVKIGFDYRLTPVELVNNGHTVQMNYQPGSGIHIGDDWYHLKQFHFHTRSEHTLGGQPFPMEIQFVHKSDAGHLAVVGVMVEQGRENRAAWEFWHALPDEAGMKRTIEGVLVNARDLLPRKRNYYRYMGSLTTPPCSEGVNWFVLQEPVAFSKEQIDAVARIMGSNARPVQPRNYRLLLKAVGRE